MHKNLERLTNPGYSAVVSVIDCGCLMRYQVPWEYWQHPNGEVHPYLNFLHDMQGHYDRWISHGVNVGEVLKGLAGPPPKGSRKFEHGELVGEVLKAASNIIRDEHTSN